MFFDIDRLFDANQSDLTWRQDQLRKGENLLKSQIGTLNFATDFGIDLRYFIESPIVFQNQVLQGHISERLSMNYLVVSEFIATISDFFTEYNLKIKQS